MFLCGSCLWDFNTGIGHPVATEPRYCFMEADLYPAAVCGVSVERVRENGRPRKYLILVSGKQAFCSVNSSCLSWPPELAGGLHGIVSADSAAAGMTHMSLMQAC